eukprot:CAMPEP_0170170818 /NCGR_PEP_ID=MMETSP0040_2-20121228/3843_1 /TAXON_ID=641309 /ORGANISM="Lotharella oceanica, Strain CCMP622" /LENGTH=194 /DNA_ID=CAMNT_0010410479 /DNA_START=120 /DNA_END=704 /DNA_ORIENTATION=-
MISSEQHQGCPPLEQVQSPRVASEYNVSLSQGRFYEVYYHDIVERACTCLSKDRHIDHESKSLRDSDRMLCGGGQAQSLWFNITEENYFIPGKNAQFDLVMECPIMNKIHFRNIVLGMGRNDGDDSRGYTWTVEYQCIEKLGVRVYVGFNIYHRDWNPPAADVEAIVGVIRQAGLGRYWDNGCIKPISRNCDWV